MSLASATSWHRQHLLWQVDNHNKTSFCSTCSTEGLYAHYTLIPHSVHIIFYVNCYLILSCVKYIINLNWSVVQWMHVKWMQFFYIHVLCWPYSKRLKWAYQKPSVVWIWVELCETTTGATMPARLAFTVHVNLVLILLLVPQVQDEAGFVAHCRFPLFP